MLEIFVIKSKSRQIRELWRSAKLPELEVARQLTQRVNIRREFEISLGSRMDVHRSENEYLIRCRGVQNLRHRSSFPNFPNLIVIEADELTKKPGWLGGAVRGGPNADPTEWKEKQDKQGQTRSSSPHGTLSASKYCSVLAQVRSYSNLGHFLTRLRAGSRRCAPVLQRESTHRGCKPASPLSHRA